ncbi:MAG TPA: alkaline phosphatase family protein [Phycisphaerae bacterium]|jgi:predicted AlkP superfamily phosphohydrolase/phosphomutase|nr:phosphodiesterase [Phycisphaerae bacterium]HOB74655.1 alkaline phosphatase family protein [Phycisphaerae bacterium]HOJ53632.1 alkaline phosphatase family protein [Phycisphaerae bacterium]HOL26357.1 alkaline phosphatase family protein [Phycisphaerae bacterium]HPP21134.1 alkaline phosphatase family protein [Phycisphaerae bacterium]
MASIEKVAIIGLDCAEPSLVFDRWLEDLPNLRRLCERGTYGHLESCLPPITVPAWSCMASSADPGTLGIYGFRNRADYSYEKLTIATSLDVREPRLWEYLDARGMSSILLGVPGTYPIVRPVRGCMTSCFLAPDTQCDYTWPRELKKEIADVVGEYVIDVKNYRTDNKEWLLQQIHEMTEKRFKLARHLVKTKPWSLFWMVELGPDRMHHGFWQYMDPQHPKHEPGHPLSSAIHDYFVKVDGWIGELLAEMDLDKTAVWVVSDHGAKCMKGGFAFNDWLIREGYLVMKEPATSPRKFNFADVDWSKTRVWGEGGYYGRCFINVKGREPQGLVPQDSYESLRNELIAKLAALPDDKGVPMGTKAYKPQEIYRKVNGVPPDLVVIFGDLHWRSVGSIGNPSVYVFENDTGPDEANHAQQGMYVLSHPSLPARGRCDGASLYDVAPTCLSLLGIPVPAGLRGRTLVG